MTDSEGAYDIGGFSRSEALILDSDHEIDHIAEPDFILSSNIMSNYSSLASWQVVRRSHENMRLYFFTFKPFNEGYDPSFDGMDTVRKYCQKLAYEDLIITREIYAAKIHYNVMLFTEYKYDVDQFHNHNLKRYKIYCSLVPYMDKYRLHHYIIKESLFRYFFSRKVKGHVLDIFVQSWYHNKYERFFNHIT